MTGFKIRVRTIGLIVSALALLVAGTAIGATLQKNGRTVTAVRTVTADTSVQTALSTWTDVPDMSVSVGVPSGERGLLVITFSGVHDCYAPGSGNAGQCRIRVLVDAAAAQPLEIVFASTTSTNQHLYETNSMQFVAGPMQAGAHIVKVQFRTEPTTPDPIYFMLESRTLTVLRSKV